MNDKDTRKATVGGRGSLFRRPGWIKSVKDDRCNDDFFRRSHLIGRIENYGHEAVEPEDQKNADEGLERAQRQDDQQTNHIPVDEKDSAAASIDKKPSIGLSTSSTIGNILEHQDEMAVHSTVTKLSTDRASSEAHDEIPKTVYDSANPGEASQSLRQSNQMDPSENSDLQDRENHVPQSYLKSGESLSSTSTVIASTQTESADTLQPQPQPCELMDETVLQILVTSPLKGSKPLIIAHKMSQRLRDVRLAWLHHQDNLGASPESIFLTWRGKRLFDVTSCKGIGLRVDAAGYIKWRGETIGTQDSHIHMEMMTCENLESRRTSQHGSSHAGTMQAVPNVARSEAEVEPSSSSLTVVLRARDRQECKMAVKKSSRIAQILRHFRQYHALASDTRIILHYDGEPLSEGMTIEEADIMDEDYIDVYLKA